MALNIGLIGKFPEQFKKCFSYLLSFLTFLHQLYIIW